MTVFERLARQSSVYTLGNILIKLSGLLVVPLLWNTTFLSEVGLANLAVLEGTAQFAIAFIGSGLTSGMLALMADPKWRAHHADVPFTTLLANLLVALTILVFFWAISPYFTVLLLDGVTDPFVVRLLGVHVLFKVLGLVPFSWLRGNERVGWYVAASIAETVTLLGSAYYFLVERGLGLGGMMWAYVLSAAVSTLVLTGAMLTRVRWSLHPAIVKELVRYGMPLTLVGLALPFLHTGDRYLLTLLAPPEELAVYAVAARFAGVINTIVVQGLQLSFAVIGLKVLGESKEGVSIHRRTFRHFSIWAAWPVLGLALFTYDATALLSNNPTYLLATNQVLPLALGFLLYGLYNITGNVLYAEGRTRAVGLGVLGAAVFNALLNLALIPLLGGLGAALATLASYALLMFVASRIVEKQFQIRFAWGVLLFVLIVVAGLWLLGLLSQSWNTAPRLLWRGLLLLLYPGIVLLAGLYRRDELKQVTDWFRGRGWSLRNL
jgi:O-antigen/teichoic acid export membrane protein